MAHLNISGLGKNFGKLEVLKNLNLDVRDLELVAVLGASGAGKSTLLRLIAGFEKPSSGTIELAGKQISSSTKIVSPEKRSIGIVPQDAALFPHLTVGQNIGFGLGALSQGQRSSRVSELLELVELTDFEDVRPEKLSGGQAQRVALARALAPKP